MSGCSNVVGAMDLLLKKMSQDELRQLKVYFRSAYWIAKEELSFNLYPKLLDLQEVNGVKVMESYRNHNACRRLMPFIYGDLQGDSNESIRKARFVSIIFYGSTDTAVLENELIYARVVEDGEPKNIYVRMQPVEDANAVGILKGIEDSMAFHPDWKTNLIATGSDGASVNLGKNHSVTALLKKDVPKLLAVHCVSHRLELSVLDALRKKDLDVFSKVKKVLQLLYNHYHRSPKACRELKSLAEAMQVKFMKPSKMNGTRWIPHLYRALGILLKKENYKLYCKHFENIIMSRSGGANCQRRAKKIVKFFKNEKLMHYMHFLLDVLEVVSELSLEYQNDSTSLPDVFEALDVAMTKLIALKQRPGRHLESFIDGTGSQLTFHGVKLNKSDLKKEKIIETENSLLLSVMDHISERVEDLESPVMKSMKIFFLENLPEEKEKLSTYGEIEISTLCNYFKDHLERVGCQVDKLINTEWMTLKLHMHSRRKTDTKSFYKRIFTSSMKEKFQNILTLVEIVFVIPTSSAICERGFSLMARIKSDWRSKMDSVMLDYLMSISLNGPPVKKYNCAKALYRWHTDGSRMRRPKFKSEFEEED